MKIHACLPCPKCDANTRVLETRSLDGAIRRRRECHNEQCNHRFSTLEVEYDFKEKSDGADS